MKLNKIKKTKKRIGRGIGSRGAKSGKGQKGQKSRAGYSKKIGHEGGQTPIYMRLPKGRGTKQKFASQAKKPFVLTTSQVAGIAKKHETKEITPEKLLELKVYKRKGQAVKIIAGKGELKDKLSITVHNATTGAKDAIEKSGGKLDIISSEVKSVRQAQGGQDKNEVKKEK